MTKRRAWLWAVLGAVLWTALGGSVTAEPGPSSFSTFGYEVTGGAAPGYVEDAACTICHREIAESYAEVGMARSFAAPENAHGVETFPDEPFYHDLSDRFYRMRRSEDGALTFERWQVDEKGRKVNAFSTDVEWVLGSGHTSRVYLYRTPGGELYQLPLAWYSQGAGWAMAPGFDSKDHQGIGRRVQRECMFCHNAYPDVPAGSDGPGQPHLFPEELPEGTGCQRCHGPGARHVSLAFAGELDEDKLRASIVNPARLPPERRNDVCNGCHLQPTVELMGVRRFERGDYSFRPGEALSDYLVLMDIVTESRAERFEINHHPYRLEQSSCFQESELRLSCLTCHDPHRKVPKPERAAHYRAACLGCHDGESLSPARHSAPLETQDCVSCHMPRRRTRDVVHVVMTDHKIQKGPPTPDLTAPLEESDSVLVDMSFYRPEEAPEGALGEAYRAMAVLRAGGGPNATDHLARQLESLETDAPAPRLALLRGQLQAGRWTEVAQLASRIYADTEISLALEWWALALAQAGDLEKASLMIEWALKDTPDRPELLYNLGNVRLQSGPEKPELAVAPLRKALEIRPNLTTAWFYLGHALQLQGKPDEAADAYRQALAVDPGHGRSYVALAELLLGKGQNEEALVLLRRGVKSALDPGPVREKLDRIEETAGGP